MTRAEFSDQGEADGTNPTLDHPISLDGTAPPGELMRVPPRQGRAARLAQGETITVINTHGTQVCDFWAFSAADPREYLSMEHLRAQLSRFAPRKGDDLVTNRRRPILNFVEDTSPGVHDTCIAACDFPRYRGLGCATYHDNCTDNLRMALIAIGMRAREIPSPLNLWMNTPVRADGRIEWLAPVSKPGDLVIFRALMDTVIAMSACPQDMLPINGKDNNPTELHFRIEPKS